MTAPARDALPTAGQIARKLAAARLHLATLERLGVAADLDHADAAAVAATQALLQAVTATLEGVNLLLPDPLPALRVNRRNLRDRFAVAPNESRTLRLLDAAGRPGVGWLWRLEQQAAASAFAPLIAPGPDGPMLYRDPLQPEAGTLPGTAVAQLGALVDAVAQLADDLAAVAPGEAARQRTRAQSERSSLL